MGPGLTWDVIDDIWNSNLDPLVGLLTNQHSLPNT